MTPEASHIYRINPVYVIDSGGVEPKAVRVTSLFIGIFNLMNISPKTQDLILELSDFSGSKLKNIPDLTYIVEIAAVSNNEKLYSDLLFSAKYVNGLAKILQKGISLSPNRNGFSVSPSDDAAKEKIRNEFHTSIVRFSELLKEFLNFAEEVIRKEFEKKYLSLTQQSMLNLNSLIHDLSWLKKYYNSLRP